MDDNPGTAGVHQDAVHIEHDQFILDQIPIAPKRVGVGWVDVLVVYQVNPAVFSEPGPNERHKSTVRLLHSWPDPVPMVKMLVMPSGNTAHLL